MKNLTELIIIIDKSGSMHGLEKDVIGGFNALIDEQKKEGETKVTTIFFNDRVDFIHEEIDIKEVKPLDERHYQTQGCTALLDAIGKTITSIDEKTDGKVLFVITFFSFSLVSLLFCSFLAFFDFVSIFLYFC